MRCAISLAFAFLASFPLAARSQAEGGQPAPAPAAGPSKTAEPPLGVVPLIDKDAPAVAVWFLPNPEIPIEDASAIHGQVYQDFTRRLDIRLVPLGKTRAMVEKTGDLELAECDGEDRCLVKIALAVKVHRIICVRLTGTAARYRVGIKSISIKKDPPLKQLAVIEGSIDDLLVGGLGDAVKGLMEYEGRGQPLDEVAVKVLRTYLPPPVEEVPRPEDAGSRPARPEGQAASPRPTAAPAPVAVERVIEEREPAVEVEARPGPPSFFRRHLGSTISLGAGLAAGCAAIALGVMASQIENEMQDPTRAWDPGRDSTGRDYALAANVLYGLAGAAVVAAVVLFFFEDGPGSEGSGVDAVPTGTGALLRF
ncbi:MAG: hypothetical protein JXR96_04010 [Deltaproteobacteria bacterium]|nr:hypothetical protein [Deltaproteobacteria bacterium]